MHRNDFLATSDKCPTSMRNSASRQTPQAYWVMRKSLTDKK